MTKPDARTCEVRIDGVWRPVGLAEAHARYASAIKRCPNCHGRVSVNVSNMAQGDHWFQHRNAHDGCPLMPSRFTGTPSPHPRALT